MLHPQKQKDCSITNFFDILANYNKLNPNTHAEHYKFQTAKQNVG